MFSASSALLGGFLLLSPLYSLNAKAVPLKHSTPSQSTQTEVTKPEMKTEVTKPDMKTEVTKPEMKTEVTKPEM